ncbi:MAG: hypothetical protein MRK01_15680 [Candidatus Scalindua sp.]|nr:hypothetical protein [Candidatus Scalindua sp.]
MKKVLILFIVPAIVFGFNIYSFAAPIQWSNNGHWYDLIFESKNWNEARDAATSKTFNSLQGHLATITSDEENAFLVTNFLQGQAGKGFWLGGYQLPGQKNTGDGWQWVTDETWSYSNWWLGNVVPEPNDWPGMGVEDGEEDYMGFSHESFGQWNDTSINQPVMRNGYFIEYEAPIGMVVIDQVWSATFGGQFFGEFSPGDGLTIHDMCTIIDENNLEYSVWQFYSLVDHNKKIFPLGRQRTRNGPGHHYFVFNDATIPADAAPGKGKIQVNVRLKKSGKLIDKGNSRAIPIYIK